jgi:hypothetical protein
MKIIATAFALLCACTALVAQAQSTAPRACIVTSTQESLGTIAPVTDCLQGVKGVPRPDIKERCEGVAKQAAWGFSKRSSSTMTWVAQCPRKRADAVCKGAFDGDFDVYYYDRDSGQLAALADNCATEQGQWRAFD